MKFGVGGTRGGRAVPRSARLGVPGVVRHVMARGIDGEEIFRFHLLVCPREVGRPFGAPGGEPGATEKSIEGVYEEIFGIDQRPGVPSRNRLEAGVRQSGIAARNGHRLGKARWAAGSSGDEGTGEVG